MTGLTQYGNATIPVEAGSSLHDNEYVKYDEQYTTIPRRKGG